MPKMNIIARFCGSENFHLQIVIMSIITLSNIELNTGASLCNELSLCANKIDHATCNKYMNQVDAVVMQVCSTTQIQRNCCKFCFNRLCSSKLHNFSTNCKIAQATSIVDLFHIYSERCEIKTAYFCHIDIVTKVV